MPWGEHSPALLGNMAAPCCWRLCLLSAALSKLKSHQNHQNAALWPHQAQIPNPAPFFFFYLFFFPSLRCPVILCSIHLHPRDGVWLLGARCTASPPVQVITAGCLPPSCPGCFCAPHAWELVSEWEEGEIKVS